MVSLKLIFTLTFFLVNGKVIDVAKNVKMFMKFI